MCGINPISLHDLLLTLYSIFILLNASLTFLAAFPLDTELAACCNFSLSFLASFLPRFLIHNYPRNRPTYLLDRVFPPSCRMVCGVAHHFRVQTFAHLFISII